MLRLAHATLAVDLLDPTTDSARLGPRFCAGGYIWQVHHHQAGPLFSGPEGPEPHPIPFNGHGLPESFRERTRDGQPLLWSHDEALAPGAGRLQRSEGRVVLAEPCTWHLALAPTHAEFRTSHAAAGHACTVVRRITLTENVLSSHSRLTNDGDTTLRLQWFAHPFFALDHAHDIAVTVPPGARLPADSGFRLEGGRLRAARRYEGKEDGAFALLELPAAEPLQVHLSHPRLPDGIRFSTTFAPFECPVWINGHTFSIEPYLALALAPGESRDWTLRYDFGSAAASPAASA